MITIGTDPRDDSATETGDDLIAIARAYLDYVARQKTINDPVSAC